jgi:hypothetical protein
MRAIEQYAFRVSKKNASRWIEIQQQTCRGSQARSAVIAIFAEHSTRVRSVIIIPLSLLAKRRSFRRL